MSLTEVANALENHPDARPFHKLLALEVRARQDPILTDQYVADAVERFGNAARLAQIYQGSAQLADETLVALAAWLNKIGRPAKTLEVLPQARASQRQDLFLHYINALAALQRWNDIKDAVDERTFSDRSSAATHVPCRRPDAPRLSNWRNERMATRFGGREHSRKIVGSRQLRRAKLCQ